MAPGQAFPDPMDELLRELGSGLHSRRACHFGDGDRTSQVGRLEPFVRLVLGAAPGAQGPSADPKGVLGRDAGLKDTVQNERVDCDGLDRLSRWLPWVLGGICVDQEQVRRRRRQRRITSTGEGGIDGQTGRRSSGVAMGRAQRRWQELPATGAGLEFIRRHAAIRSKVSGRRPERSRRARDTIGGP